MTCACANRAHLVRPVSPYDAPEVVRAKRRYAASVGAIDPATAAAIAPIVDKALDKAGDFLEDAIDWLACEINPAKCRREARKKAYVVAAGALWSEVTKAQSAGQPGLALALAEALLTLDQIAPFDAWKSLLTTVRIVWDAKARAVIKSSGVPSAPQRVTGRTGEAGVRVTKTGELWTGHEALPGATHVASARKETSGVSGGTIALVAGLGLAAYLASR